MFAEENRHSRLVRNLESTFAAKSLYILSKFLTEKMQIIMIASYVHPELFAARTFETLQTVCS